MCVQLLHAYVSFSLLFNYFKVSLQMMCECIICLIMDDMFVIDHLGHYRETHTLVLSFSQEYEFQMVRCSYELICCYRDTFCFVQDAQYSGIVCLALLFLLFFA